MNSISLNSWYVNKIINGDKTKHRMPLKTKKVKFSPGDIIYVKEKFMISPSDGCSFGEFMRGSKLTVFYENGSVSKNIDNDMSGWLYGQFNGHISAVRNEYNSDYYGLWRSERFMPEWASRVFLKIKSVKIEKFSNAKESDMIKEGCIPSTIQTWYDGKTTDIYREVWDGDNPKYSWDKDPMTILLNFKKLEVN
jgi:hypothetical protein